MSVAETQSNRAANVQRARAPSARGNGRRQGGGHEYPGRTRSAARLERCPPERHTQPQAPPRQSELSVLDLPRGLLDHLQARVRVIGAAQECLQVAGSGIDLIALECYRTIIEWQVLQSDGNGLGRVLQRIVVIVEDERAVVVEDDDAGGARIARGECAQI